MSIGQSMRWTVWSDGSICIQPKLSFGLWLSQVRFICPHWHSYHVEDISSMSFGHSLRHVLYIGRCGHCPLDSDWVRSNSFVHIGTCTMLRTCLQCCSDIHWDMFYTLVHVDNCTFRLWIKWTMISIHNNIKICFHILLSIIFVDGYKRCIWVVYVNCLLIFELSFGHVMQTIIMTCFMD